MCVKPRQGQVGKARDNRLLRTEEHIAGSDARIDGEREVSLDQHIVSVISWLVMDVLSDSSWLVKHVMSDSQDRARFHGSVLSHPRGVSSPTTPHFAHPARALRIAGCTTGCAAVLALTDLRGWKPPAAQPAAVAAVIALKYLRSCELNLQITQRHSRRCWRKRPRGTWGSQCV